VAEPTERPLRDLSRRTAIGLQWTYLGTAVGGVLQFGMAALLGRLLTPLAFGLVALAGIFLRFVDYFARAGITQALIQKPSLSRTDIRAGFLLSSGLGVTFAAVAYLAAPLAATIAREPGLVPVLRWLSLGLIAHGLGAPSIALLRRGMKFRPLAMLDVGSYAVGYVLVGLAMAFAGRGVDALIAAMLTQASLRAAGAYLFIRHPIKPTLDRAAYRSILAYGSRVSLISFLEFIRSSLDTLAVGRFAGASQLGLYNRANLLADLPAYHLSAGLAQVLFPSFSAIQFDLRRLRGAYLSAVGMTAAIIFPLNAGMAVAANEIVLVVLGPQWKGSIAVMPILLLASSITLTSQFAGIVAEAQAALNVKLLVAAASAVTLAALLLLARGGPLQAYGAALVGAATVSHLGYVAILSRTLKTPLITLLRPYAPAALGAAIVAGSIALVRLTSLQLLSLPLLPVLVAEVVTGASALFLVLRFGPLRVFRDDFARRLSDAGLLKATGGRISRLLRWSIGHPNNAQVPRD
jgi:lipopolysaccharide exporter